MRQVQPSRGGDRQDHVAAAGSLGATGEDGERAAGHGGKEDGDGRKGEGSFKLEPEAVWMGEAKQALKE